MNPARVDPVSAPAPDVEEPLAEQQLSGVLVKILLGSLMIWCLLHAVATVAATGGSVGAGALVTVGTDVFAGVLLGLATGLLPAKRPYPGVTTALFVAVGVLAVVRGAAIAQPLLGLDAGLVFPAAALLLRRHQLRVVAGVVCAAAACLAGYGITKDLAGMPTAMGSGLEWVYVTTAVVGATVVTFAMRSYVDRMQSANRPSADNDAAGIRDGLTGLTNRAGLDLVATPMVEHARRTGQAVHCLYLDVDGLRQVNTVAGLAAGDNVLREVASIIMTSVRATDVAARWSGDEMVVFGPGTGMSPLELERRIRAQIVTNPPVPIEVWNGRVSIGSATLVPWDNGGLHELINRSENDMQMRRSLRRQVGSGPVRVPRPSGPAV